MEIKYLGHSSFRLKTKEATVITDPFDPNMVGLPYPKVAADIVTVSHGHQDHNYVEKVGGTPQRAKPLIFDAPGEYEASEVGVVGHKSYHDDKEGAERGENIIFVFQMETLLLAHLGDLGHVLTEKQIEELGPIDVLFIPIGGVFTIDPKQAVSLVKAIGPSYVIPMHYQTEGLDPTFNELATVDDFLDKGEFGTIHREDKIKVSKDSLPDDTEAVVLSS